VDGIGCLEGLLTQSVPVEDLEPLVLLDLLHSAASVAESLRWIVPVVITNDEGEQAKTLNAYR